MLKIEKKLADPRSLAPVLKKRARRLVLPFAERSKSRVKVILSDGTEAGLFLERGTQLRGGDVLVDAAGGFIVVEAAPEAVYQVTAGPHVSDVDFALLRAAYHLGNRHVPVQLARGALLLERDPVLRDLLRRLGMTVDDVIEPFEPEAGAYGGGHRHDHDGEGGSLGEQLSIEAHRHGAACTHDHHAHAPAHVHGSGCQHGHAHGDDHDHTHAAAGHVHGPGCGHAHHDHEHAHGVPAGLKFAPVPRRR